MKSKSGFISLSVLSVSDLLTFLRESCDTEPFGFSLGPLSDIQTVEKWFGLPHLERYFP